MLKRYSCMLIYMCLFAVVCMVFLVSCQKTIKEPTVEPVVRPTHTPFVRPDDLPDYLERIWPAPDTKISLEDYNNTLDTEHMTTGKTGVGVVLYTSKVVEIGDFDVNWVKRSTLLVDNENVSEDTLLGQIGLVLITGTNQQGDILCRDTEPYYIAWRVPLELGEHQATFQVQKTSGTLLEYSWSFAIIP